MVTAAPRRRKTVHEIRNSDVLGWEGPGQAGDVAQRVAKTLQTLDHGVGVVIVLQPGERADDGVEGAVDRDPAAGGLAASDVLGDGYCVAVWDVVAALDAGLVLQLAGYAVGAGDLVEEARVAISRCE